MVQIASFATAAEAEYTRSYLDGQGVPSFVDGATAGTALSYVGSAIGGIRLLVDDKHLERAKEVLAELHQPEDPADAWFCGKCQEEVEGTFAVCWSCGGEKSRVATDERPFEPAEVQVPSSGLSVAPSSNNPYEPPPEESVTPPVPETDQQANELMDRAWKAIILGTVFLPFIMQPYGLFLLMQATRVTHDFSPELNRKFYRILITGILSCALWIALLRTMLV